MLDEDNDGIACETTPYDNPNRNERPVNPGGNNGNRIDRDCADFASQAAAQAVLDRTFPEDPERLDADDDGIACEGGGNGNPPDRDCRDFRSQREAQAALDATFPEDPERLDADDDGIACEEFPYDDGGNGGNGGRMMPPTGGPPLLLPGALLLIGAGLVCQMLRREVG